MADIRLTVGQAVVKFLDNQYVAAEIDGVMTETKFVEGFYTIFGHGCVLGIGEALSMEKHSLKVYQGKNEQGMALAAASYAKTNNRLKIIPCVSSIGPGSANMVTAAATATVNNLPLLLFMGDSFASRQPDPVLQQVEQTYNPTVTTTDAFRAVTKFFDKVTRPEMIMTSLLNAMRVLTDPAECGAAAIAISQDVQGESYLYPESFFEKRVHLVRIRQPENYELEKAFEVIKASSFPLVVAGGGVRYSFASNALKDFCLNHNIPFAETQAGKSAVESSFALNLGGIGVTGNACANTVAAKADLIIGVGTRFSDFTTSSKWLYPNAKVVTVNVYTVDYSGGGDAYLAMAGTTKLFADVQGALSSIYILADPAGFEENTGALRYLDGSLPEGGSDEDWWNMVYRWTDCPVLTGLELGGYGPDATQAYSGDSQEYMSRFYVAFRGAWNEGAAKSSRIERMSGYAPLVMERYPMGPEDCFLAVSSSGINPFIIEMAQLARDVLERPI